MICQETLHAFVASGGHEMADFGTFSEESTLGPQGGHGRGAEAHQLLPCGIAIMTVHGPKGSATRWPPLRAVSAL